MKKFFLSALVGLLGVCLLAVLIVSLRQAQANREIQAEGQADLTAAPALAATSQLTIIPLYEREKMEEGLISGHGVSYLIRTDSGSVLLDMGNNPQELAVAPFIQNMAAQGIAADEIDAVFISHPHPDHIGGNAAWWGKTISFGTIASSLSDLPIFLPGGMRFPGAASSVEPVLLSADVATTGVLSFPEVFPLSLVQPKGAEQALVVHVAGKGLVLITGCGHPGLENLVTRAERLYGLPVTGVVGGLHYLQADAAALQPQIEFLLERQPTLVALSPHDSAPLAIQAFQAAFPDAYQGIQVGKAVQLP